MKIIFPFLFNTLIFVVSYSQPSISFQTLISSGLSSPVDVVSPPDGTNRLFIVERTGTIRIWHGTSLIASPFLNMSSLIRAMGGEQGLLSLAFHPNYSSNRYFFVYYTDVNGSIAVSRYQVSATDANLADNSSGVNLLTITKRFANHNGGKLLFGSDGLLYFGTGDGGSGGDPDNNAQNPLSLLGKMIRIDVNNSSTASPYYAIPPTNPFVANAAYRGEIIATRLRNPWRYSFDRLTSDLWITDVGESAWEEVNFIPFSQLSGRNYGWSCYEANHSFKSPCGAPGSPSYTFPIFEYPHNNTNGGFSVTGGVVYWGAEFPNLQGYYLVTDFVSGNGWLIMPNGSGGYNVTMQTWPTQISSFGESQDGTLFATGLNGRLYKVIASQALPVRLVSFAGRVANNRHELFWEVASEQAADIYIVEKRSSSAESFTEVFRTLALRNSNTNKYNAVIDIIGNQGAFYRLKIISKNGQVTYSPVVNLKEITTKFKATISTNVLYLTLPDDAKTITLFNTEGKLLKQQAVVRSSQVYTLSLTGVPRGTIIIKVVSDRSMFSTKVVYR